MLRISTTTLESFRLFIQPEQDWMSEADLLATIRGEFTPTPEILAGRAFDRILERPERFAVDGGFSCEGHFFSDAMMAPALAVFDRRGVWQVKATQVYPPDCVVVSKADQILGAQLIENKTTSSAFNFEKYADSYQWRFMADVFRPSVITYRVFLLGLDRSGEWELRGIEAFNLFPYAGLHADCQALVERFRAFVVARGLDGLLRERQAQEETRAVPA